jgi:hypothetical protein
MLLTKQPQGLVSFLQERRWRCFGSQPQSLDGTTWVAIIPGEHREDDARALPHVTIGCSVMNQSEADKMREPMQKLQQLGWRTHVWYEPALGPVNWAGWERIELLIVGGESGADARRFEEKWASDSLDWCREYGIAFRLKQGGSNPSWGTMPGDPKAELLENLPEALRVRELPRSFRPWAT